MECSSNVIRHNDCLPSKCPFPVNTQVNSTIYVEIESKVCSTNQKLHDVPGDGNCLFHSVSLAMIDQSKNVGDAKHLRNKVCQYLTVSDSDWIEPHLVIGDGDVVDKQTYKAYIYRRTRSWIRS